MPSGSLQHCSASTKPWGQVSHCEVVKLFLQLGDAANHTAWRVSFCDGRVTFCDGRVTYVTTYTNCG